jgi:hypothetical protein
MLKKILATMVFVFMLSGCTGVDGFTSLLSDNVENGDSTPMSYNFETNKGISEKYDYYYNLLDEDNKALYNIIYNAIMNHSQAVRLDDVTYDVLDRCFNSVLRDHPEIYYVYGYTYSESTFSKTIDEFTPNYNFTTEELEYCDSQIADYVNKFMENAPVNGSDYDKIKYIYEYVPLNITYDLDIISNQSIYGAFVSKRCACNGYAKAVQYLAKKLDLVSVFVVGEADNGTQVASHAWNIVSVDGNWYQVDTTWADRQYKAGDNVVSKVAYDYLCTNDNIMYSNHKTDDFIDYPKCESLDMFYYVKEKAYITQVNNEAVSAAFARAIGNGNDFVVLKCATSDVQAQLKQWLKTDNRIFNYIYASNVNCSEYKDSNVLIYYW